MFRNLHDVRNCIRKGTVVWLKPTALPQTPVPLSPRKNANLSEPSLQERPFCQYPRKTIQHDETPPCQPWGAEYSCQSLRTHVLTNIKCAVSTIGNSYTRQCLTRGLANSAGRRVCGHVESLPTLFDLPRCNQRDRNMAS